MSKRARGKHHYFRKPNRATSVGPPRELEVDALALGGDGVARDEGKVCFVNGGLPGERVLAKTTQRNKRFDRAVVERVLRPSALRVEPVCSHFSSGCGGCTLQYLSYPESLELKAKALLQELQKLSALKWPEPELHPTLSPHGARSRMRFHCIPGEGIGLRARRSHRLIPTPHCEVAHLAIRRALNKVSAFCADFVEESDMTVEVDSQGRVFLSFERSLPKLLFQRLSQPLPEPIVGIQSPNQSVGLLWIDEEIAQPPLRYRRRAGSFGQATPEAEAALRGTCWQILKALAPATVLDLFAGSGNFSLFAAASGAKVDAVEGEEGAIAALQANAQANGLKALRGFRADLRQGLPAELANHYGLVILDPPRGGARGLGRALLELTPQDIIYVSCEATQLARDLEELGGHYSLHQLHVYEMFPWTPHVEVLLWLRACP